MRRSTCLSAKRKREAAIKDWKWLLWDSAFATEYLHQKLGAGWTAVLKEACCVSMDVDKDKVERLRKKGDRNRLRLWPRHEKPFKDMVPTVSLLEWCVAQKYKPDAATFEATARGGDMDAVKWLRRKKCPWEGWDEYAFTDLPEHNACNGAAEGGHLGVLKWLRDEGCRCDENTCISAAKGGHVHILKYLHENGCPVPQSRTLEKRLCRVAAEGGHLDVLKYACELECEWSYYTSFQAAKGGHLHVLEFLHENGCAFKYKQTDINVSKGAAEGGHLDVLKWLRENGCPWNAATCGGAARGGHMQLLKYLRENGCPWDADTCCFAALRGDLDMLKYAHENGCPIDHTHSLWSCSMYAAKSGNKDVLKYVRANGGGWDQWTHVCAVYASPSLGEWVRKEGCPRYRSGEELGWAWKEGLYEFFAGDDADEPEYFFDEGENPRFMPYINGVGSYIEDHFPTFAEVSDDDDDERDEEED